MRKLVTLLLLYFAQGLPFGFQSITLPLLLRSRGTSLQALGLVGGALAAPWLAKALWAPWVDRYGSERFGRRKSWIVPMQAALCVCAVLAAQTERPALLFALVFAMNLFAATQDIAVDGLVVSWLEARELGMGNALQVVGYKLGMLTGGGLLVRASVNLGMSGMFYAMAALMFIVMLVAIFMREPPPAQPAEAAEVWRLLDVWRALRQALQHAATLPLIAVVLTYKMGETLADAMWKPMLFDRGFALADVGEWTGTYGMLASLIGSFASGLWLRSRSLSTALQVTALLRAAGVAAEWWISTLGAPLQAQVIAVTCIEHLLGGAITTVMFALMMRHTKREIGSTHYTLLASLEVWGKLPLGAASGVIDQHLGYPALYALGTGLCVAFAALVLWLRGRFELAPRPPPVDAA